LESPQVFVVEDRPRLIMLPGIGLLAHVAPTDMSRQHHAAANRLASITYCGRGGIPASS
jgi:hypothetical protein